MNVDNTLSSGQKDMMEAAGKFRRIRLCTLTPWLSHGEWYVMENMDFLIQQHPGSKVRVSDLVRNMRAPAPAVSRTLRRMEQKEMLVRTTDPEDRRNTIISMTPAGQEAMEECAEIREEYMAAVRKRYGEEEFCRLAEELKRFAEISEEELRRLQKKNEDNGGNHSK